jgi:MOSC domain-containing protein YiiM
MAELRKEAWGPRGDAARHRDAATLAAGMAVLARAPADVGLLSLLVRRRPDGVRETPVAIRLTPEEGVPGDGWNRRPPRDLEAQLAVMHHDVATLIANGQPLSLFGDNLFVTLDLSAANLPVGTRVRLGADALVVMTAKPHNGCSKFKERFGADALDLVQAPATRPRNLRGVYWKVVEPGEVRVGAEVRVLSRGPG